MPAARPAPHRARRVVVVAAAAVAAALAVVGCSSSPDTKALEVKLRQVNGLTATESHCIATTLRRTLTAKQLRTVATADGRGGITDANTVALLDDAVKSCVITTTTTTPTGPTTSILLQEP